MTCGRQVILHRKFRLFDKMAYVCLDQEWIVAIVRFIPLSVSNCFEYVKTDSINYKFPETF